MPTLYHPVSRIYITQRFGQNPAFYKPMKGHNGIDYRTKFADTPLGHIYVYPLTPGRVIEVGDQDIYRNGKLVARNGYGRFVRIQHDDGAQSVYAHLEKWYVKVGQRVDLKSIMGLTDNTGRSTGSHLHVGYRPKGWEKTYNNGYYGYIDFYSMLKPRP